MITKKMFQNDVNEKKVAQQIRNQYEDRSQSKMEKLKKLDQKVKRPAEIVAYVLGIIGSLVLGTGMCLAMKVIGDFMALGVIVGCLGIALVSVNYFIYKKIISNRKKKYGDTVMQLADEMINK